MDLETVIQSQLSQKEKKYIIYQCLYVESREMAQMNLFAKQKQKHRLENNLIDTKRERADQMNWEIGIDIYTLLCIKQVVNEDLIYSTGNSTQCSVTTKLIRKSKEEGIYVCVCVCVCVCVTDSLCCTAESNTTLQSNYTPMKILKKIL